MSLEDLCDNPVTIQAVTFTQDSQGGKQPTYATPGVAMLASVQPMSARRIASFARDGSSVDHDVYFAFDPGVKVRDRIVWDGKNLLVDGPASDEAGRGVCWHVVAELVR